MKYTLQQIAAWLDAEIEGDSSQVIHTVARIEEGVVGSISFLANPKYTEYIYTTQASAVIVAKDFTPNQKISPALLRVKDPYLAFTSLLEKAQAEQQQNLQGISDLAFIDPSAKIGADVYIGPFAYVGADSIIGDRCQIHAQVYIGSSVRLGENTLLYPQARVLDRCEVGKHCIIHAGSTIGSDGFGFAPQADGSFKKIPQTGNVQLEDHVEIGSNSTIDRATVGSTIIRKGAKLDNLVQIAHNVEVGPSTVIAAQAGIAGSTKLGSYVMIGGQVGIVGHLNIADQTKIDAQSGVNRNIKEPGQAFRGSPIQGFRQQLKSEVLFRRLEEMHKKILALEEALAQRS
ncbi:MAG: UDP-3-O-(3-hydroxymyristoyl)glucosamine N-acyltransferase [Bacteroidota bacterium]